MDSAVHGIVTVSNYLQLPQTINIPELKQGLIYAK